MALDAQIPTVDEFLTRFPSFDGNEDQIEILIPEAAREVGDTWIEADQKPAILYLVAHLLTMESSAFVSRGEVTSESFGPMSTSYASKGATAYGQTEYGLRYEKIRRRNVGAGVVVVGGVGPV